MDFPEYLRGAIFDLDGTLLDSLGSWSEVDRRFFERRGLPLPADYFDSIKTLDLKDAALYTKRRFSLPDDVESMIGEWLDLIREEYAERIELKPFAKEWLSALFSRGIKLAVATSSAPELFMPALVRNGIDGFFSAFVTTREAGRGKEYPDVYLEAARRLRLPPDECAVFEDIFSGIASARSGGFFTVAVAETRSVHEEAALRERADLFLRSFGELLS